MILWSNYGCWKFYLVPKSEGREGGGGDGEETKVQSTLDIIIKSSLLCTFLERRWVNPNRVILHLVVGWLLNWGWGNFCVYALLRSTPCIRRGCRCWLVQAVDQQNHEWGTRPCHGLACVTFWRLIADVDMGWLGSRRSRQLLHTWGIVHRYHSAELVLDTNTEGDY